MSMNDEERKQIMDDLMNADVDIPMEIKLEIIDLTDKMADLVMNYNPTARLFVLEAAMTSSINHMSPTLGAMFQQMLKNFKAKANVLLQLTDALAEHAEKTDKPTPPEV
jgi:hypothetical protein